MRFWGIFRFELTYQVRRPWPWLFVVVLIGLDFLMTRDGSVSEVLYSDFYLNSPFAILKTTVFGCLMWLVMAAAVAGDSAARDVATGMHPLTYTVPVSKLEYLGGRFLAALAINALMLISVQVGILLGVYLPGVDAELIGPFRPAAFLTAYVYIALPNAFAATAIQFLLAVKSGRAMASYFGSFLIVFMGFFVAAFLLFHQRLGTLLDPIGIRFVIEDIARLWTPVEKNVRLLELDGIVLANRLLWVSIAFVAMAITYLTFRFKHRTGVIWWRRRKRQPTDGMLESESSTYRVSQFETRNLVPAAAGSFGFAMQVRQMSAIAWISAKSIAKSWAGIAMLVLIPLMTIPVVVDQMGSNGVPLLPSTARVVVELTGDLGDELGRWVIIPFLIIFFAGELVWRERDAGVGEITDAMPGSNWAPFLGKFLGLMLVLTLFTTLQTSAGIIAQTLLGYTNYELGLYGVIMFGIQLTEYLLFAMLALVIHVVVDHKYIGHMVAIIAFVFIAIASLFGVEHNMLVFGAGPAWSYTDMRGFGPTLAPWLWFKLYWAAWALLLAVVARLLWARGKETELRVRLGLARHLLKHTMTIKPTLLAAGIAVFLIAGFGAFIFYNTNILNTYLTTSELKERAAEYERLYGKYAHVPQPWTTDATLHVDIYPERRTLDIHGSYQLVNPHAEAISFIHISTLNAVRSITLSQPASRVIADKDLHFEVYQMTKPLQPGDSLRLEFTVHVEAAAFRENGPMMSLAENGTHFTGALLPSIGYQSSRELITPSDRRAHGLESRPLIASLYDIGARKKESQGIMFEAILSTDKDQIAVAPGALRRSWMEGDRSYFHYVTDGSIGNDWSFFSANYSVREEQWHYPDPSKEPVAIRIFHHPQHTAHVDRVVRSITASLDYYTKEFGPYQHNHLTVVEHPGLGEGMHADPTMISHPEGFTAWDPIDKPQNHNHPYAIVAHEMAHQWTVPIAPVEGAPVMSESVAWYYGMKLVEHARGAEHLWRLRNYMRQPYPYPAIRRGEPLLRGFDPYLSYRRGPFALYTLSEYVGEDKINDALRRLLEKHRQPESSYATTLDLFDELESVMPDSLYYLLHDLFEVNTYWDLKTEQATAEQAPSGDWLVTMDIEARKLVTDSAGVETVIPMDDWIEVGVYSADEAPTSVPLYLQKQHIRSGRQTITLIVPEKPARAGIDPNYLMIDLDDRENMVNVKFDD